jgi:hypothetical protein
MDGGGGLSTIWGCGLVKREKKLAHIVPDLIINPYKFLFINGGILKNRVIVLNRRVGHTNLTGKRQPKIFFR